MSTVAPQQITSQSTKCSSDSIIFSFLNVTCLMWIFFLRTPTSPPHLLLLSEQRVKSVARCDKWEFFSFLVYFSFLCTLLQQCVAFGVFMLNGRASFFFSFPHIIYLKIVNVRFDPVYFFVITELIHTESVFILATIQPQNCPVFMFRVEN